METYNVLHLTGIPEFDWAFTSVAVWFPVFFTIKATIRIFMRS